MVRVNEICSLGILFFFSWCVFWDQGKEEKVKYDDVKSERHRKHFIYKTEIGGFLCFFFFLLFVIESSVLKSNPGIENLFLCCSVLKFISFPHSGFFFFFFVCQRGLCSTVTGLRYCGRLRETDIKLSYYYYCTFGEKKKKTITVENFRFEINN